MRWLAALLLAVPLTGCAASAADDGRLQVTAGFYPLVWVSERVGGEHVDVTGLTDPGVEPHDIEPTFARTVALARADLVVVEHGLQPAIDEAVAQNAEGRVLDVTDVVHLHHGDEHAEEERARPRRGRPALLARPPAARRRRRRGGRGPGRARPTERRVVRRQRHRPARRPRRPRRRVRLRPGRLRATRGRVEPRRVRVLGQVRDRGRPRRRPDPRRRADARRPRPAPAADPRGGHHHGVLRAAGQPEAHRRSRSRPRPAHGRPRPDRGARRATTPRTGTTTSR